MTAAGTRKQRTKTLEQAYNAILELILNGSIPPGAPLRLQELSDNLGMSMMPIREALRQLESSGLVEIVPHRGARVREISVVDLLDTYQTRITLEGILCSRAAANFDGSNARAAEAALARQSEFLRQGDAIQARIAHKEFHYAIYGAAGSTWMLRSIEQTWHNSERYRLASELDDDLLTTRRREHELMLETCVNHQPEQAYSALRAHLISTVAHIDKSVAKRLEILTAATCT